jgi:mycothiol synthase
MRIEYLQKEMLPAFIKYCQKHLTEHDESFIQLEDLRDFVPDEDNPTYILLNDSGIITGAASLMLEPRLRTLHKGRFRIFHTMIPSVETYGMMLDALMKHTEGIDLVYLFIPEEKIDMSHILTNLGFGIERFSWHLRKEGDAIAAPVFPDGMSLRPLRPNQDEAVWCDIVNASFAHLAGHTKSTPDRIKKEMTSETVLPGGMQILWKKDQPIGLICIDTEIENGEKLVSLGPIAILPEYQGMGLGRNLVRAGICFGKSKGFLSTELSVNAENSKAANLYLSEGFKKTQVAVCYNKAINQQK